MFETQRQAEIPLPPELNSENIQCWSHIQSRLHMYWFHVVYEITHASAENFSYILFLTDIEQLIQLENDPDIELIEVDLVSPGYMNGESRWKMDILKEIIIGTEPDSYAGELTYIFVLNNNMRIIYSDSPTTEDNIQNKVSIFKIK